MDQEINLDSVLALEKQIGEHEGHEKTIIQFKRTRNPLLNVSTLLPPEILGSVFRWNVIPDGEFGADRTIPSSSATTGSKSPRVLRSFGASGEIPHEIGNVGMLVAEPLRLIW